MMIFLAMLHLIGQYRNVNHGVPSRGSTQAISWTKPRHGIPLANFSARSDMMHPHQIMRARSLMADCGAALCRGDHFAH
jgi:hypothetical protein